MEKEKFMEKLSEEERKEGTSEDAKREEDPFARTVDFSCGLCGLSEKCHYLGKRPMFVKGLVEFKEDSYVLVDPFTPRETRLANSFLLLGGLCAHCGKEVCLECSLFYARRYCNKCAEFYMSEFPKETQGKIAKMSSGKKGDLKEK
jgi:hypothetical protein